MTIRPSRSDVAACALLLFLVSSVVPAAELEVEVGIGYDDNPFLTPGDAYFDQNQMEIIEPNRRSGFFVPVSLRGDLELPRSTGRSRFILGYRLRGNFYGDSDTSNADEMFAKVEPGYQLRLSEEHERILKIFPFAAYNKEIFFDRDTGLGSESGNVDASDRYTYLALGGEVQLEYEVSRMFEFFVEGLFEGRDYEDVPGVESFDQNRYQVGSGIGLRFSKIVKLRLDYSYQARDYDERTARDRLGDNADTNPALEYTFQYYGATLRVMPLSKWVINLDWDRKNRDDEYVGYNDYSEDRYRVRSALQLGRWRLRAMVATREREFDNAFIFDNPIDPVSGQSNPRKSYDMFEYKLRAEVSWTKNLRVFAEVEHKDQDTEDPRYGYARTRSVVGVKWVQ